MQYLIKRLPYLFCIIILLNIIAGCSGNTGTKDTAVPAAYSITDSQGYTIDFAAKPRRIVSFSISTDEILLDMLPSDRIAAVSSLADDPGISNVVQKAKEVPSRVPRNSNAEAVLALNPDLIIIPDFVDANVIQSLRDLNLNVYVYKTPFTVEEVKNCIREMAKLTGDPQNADKLLAYMDTRLEQVQQKLGQFPSEQQKRVAFMRDNGVYYSSKTSFHDVFQNAGLYDITSDIENRPDGLLSQEKIVRLKPDIFIMADWNYDGKHDPDDLKNTILSNEAYTDIPAWQNKNIIMINGSRIFSLSQYMADAILELAQKAYPEKFN